MGDLELEGLRWLFLFVLGGLVYMIKRELTMKDKDIEQLKIDVQNIRQNYLHRDDFKEFKTELREMFTDIKEDIRSLKHEKN